MRPPGKRQLTFDDLPPRSRTTDPNTSHKAEREMRQSEHLGTQLAEVLELVRAHPGWTTRELAGGDQGAKHRYSRRLSDLKRLGHVKSGWPRPCRINGRTCSTWWPEPWTMLVG